MASWREVQARAAGAINAKVGEPGLYQVGSNAAVPCRPVVDRGAQSSPKSLLDGDFIMATLLVAEVGNYVKGAILTVGGVSYMVDRKVSGDFARFCVALIPV